MKYLFYLVKEKGRPWAGPWALGLGWRPWAAALGPWGELLLISEEKA